MKNILHPFLEPVSCPLGKRGNDADDIPCISCRYFLGTEQPSGDLAATAEIIKCKKNKR